ncbi:DEAD-like helicase [Mesorhizobium opportunistum]|uniref:DEAD-like helicase n=1 Tax=Mesorhizobium opportunistum (strain LMG 24607 / HAMBI 3007 / WSM2075) TaxID=536019 RepID=F7XZW0_MESOW|nr:DEAD-like helicase [Mesorhizobium opportunistum]AEH88174.1 DEAD-like helicase [Mesorhizobium opportunistum WSM2075]
MTLQSYHDFLAQKRVADVASGLIDLPDLPAFLFPHQRDIVRWSLRRGRAAVFAGTGLGKTLMELVWARVVSNHTGKPVLLFAPLAVGPQHEDEARTYDLLARVVTRDGVVDETAITNYQKLDLFDLSRYGGIALDESSILKSFDGHYRNRLIEIARPIPFRLAATATPAPNDFMELGSHAEFLGVMSYFSMLATFFTHDGSETKSWRLKGHAENEFWRWMASWAVMLRKPSDLGYSDDGYELPPLTKRLHVVETGSHWDDGGQFSLLPVQAKTLQERNHARKSTIEHRIARAVALTPADGHYVWWGNLNAETEGVTKAIPGAVEVRGSDHDDYKEEKLKAFSQGKIRVLVTKPSICGFGMNWQHCHRTGFVGLNDSFEQVYQAIRRFWRFGQGSEVTADFIAADTEGAIIANLDRKEQDAERMAAAMVRHMADLSSVAVRGAALERHDYQPKQKLRLPAWEEFA